MAAIEYVVVEANKAYEGGLGYQGPLIKKLGFPEAPYGPAGAKIFVRQAAKLNPNKKFRIEEYRAS